VSTFQSRLNQACRENLEVPEKGRGQQTYIAERMNVSQEAVRKWLSGDSQPKPAAMRKLAQLLGVDHVWLALGTDNQELERRKISLGKANAAHYALIGFLIESGYSCAPPDQEDGLVDIEAIGHGVYKSIIVRTAESEDDRLSVSFPAAAMDLATITAVRRNSSSFAFDFVWFTSEIFLKSGYRQGNDIHLNFKYSDDKGYSVGSQKVNRFLDNTLRTL